MISRWAKWVLLFIYLTVSDGRITTYVDPFCCSYNYWKKYGAFWFFCLSFIYFYKVGCKYIESMRLTLAFAFLGGVQVHAFNIQHYSALFHLDRQLVVLVPTPVGHCGAWGTPADLSEVPVCGGTSSCPSEPAAGQAAREFGHQIQPGDSFCLRNQQGQPCVALKNKYKHRKGKSRCRHPSSSRDTAQGGRLGRFWMVLPRALLLQERSPKQSLCLCWAALTPPAAQGSELRDVLILLFACPWVFQSQLYQK